MITTVTFGALLLVAFSSGFSMGKRDTFSPFDSKDTPSIFTKNDIKDALLVAELKSKVAAKNAAKNNAKNAPYIPSPPHKPAVPVASINLDPLPSEQKEIQLGGKSNADDSFGSLYYYYYPTKSESRDTYVEQPPYSLYDLEATSYSGGGGGYGGYGTFFDLDADHTRYLIKVALPLFVIGGVLLALSAFSVATSSSSRSLDESASFLTKFEDNLGRISNDYFAMSEECLDRIICEIGYVSASNPITKKFLRVVETFVPERLRGKVDVFKSTALGKKYGKTCRLYGCSLSKRNKMKTS